MHTLKRNAIVPYSCKQMFELVNDINSYPAFLPWCQSSRVASQTQQEIIAELAINWKGIHKSFTTRNSLIPNKKIQMTLVNGPLHRLDGIWEFIELDENACKVVLEMEFEFTGHFIDKLFQPIFQHIANTFVESFCSRAKELYGAE